MEIIDFLRESLEGRGFYPILMVILSWTYTAVISGVLIFQFFLYIFKIKYYNNDFNKNSNNVIENKKEENKQ